MWDGLSAILQIKDRNIDFRADSIKLVKKELMLLLINFLLGRYLVLGVE